MLLISLNWAQTDIKNSINKIHQSKLLSICNYFQQSNCSYGVSVMVVVEVVVIIIMVLDTDCLWNVITFSFDFISLNLHFHGIVLHENLIAGSDTATL